MAPHPNALGRGGARLQLGGNRTADDDDKREMDAAVSEEQKKQREELEKAPMRAELKHLERRWTKKNIGYITEPTDEDIPEQNTNWYEKYALCVIHQYSVKNEFIARSFLHVNSPSLKAILKEVIGDRYPGQSYLTSDITVEFPAHSIYHYRHELAAKAKDLEPGSESARHLPILLDFINEQFKDTIKNTANLLEQGLMTYGDLWAILRPGCLVYSKRLGQHRVYRLKKYTYLTGMCPALQLDLEHVDFDGKQFGTRHAILGVRQFSGAVPIISLMVFPLDSHPDPAGVVDLATQRGRRWESLAGQNFRMYKGLAFGEKLEKAGDQRSKHNISGRVMIDTATHHRICADDAYSVTAFLEANEQERKEVPGSDEPELVSQDAVKFAPLTDEQAMLATSMVRGFSFNEKKFLDFFVDKISDIEWNTRCFEQLVLPESQKELVQALVAEHTASTFDDIVQGKGKGLILVLHGPPGVGKTLTAECVAEFSRRPLYIVSSGDLGTAAETLDERLSKTLDLASTWKAVLLIDEADVFLERRSLHDLERNSLVSIFLRTLEYYSGILFMTTNRVRTFDDAFKSRIHVPLKYDGLSKESRLKVWKNFLAKVEGGVDVDEAGLERLAEGELNGRQIKNIVRTAKSLAAHKKRRLDCSQLQQVVDIQMNFERELSELNGDFDVVER
ncbi:AAA family ATPase [Colletotrichum karsti]|uniref:AAA family ATPase n=1 Tax=Colletotrichum karsti TaxID=1095194 RepID=A0A9P6LGH2_9PEZI|nr:AAA family ATPase [Colletotrichum karsti]KAF9872533.1 AAA family ATPase [Colletotrichum karsti]